MPPQKVIHMYTSNIININQVNTSANQGPRVGGEKIFIPPRKPQRGKHAPLFIIEKDVAS
jgi:hypothetical protein